MLHYIYNIILYKNINEEYNDNNDTNYDNNTHYILFVSLYFAVSCCIPLYCVDFTYAFKRRHNYSLSDLDCCL